MSLKSLVNITIVNTVPDGEWLQSFLSDRHDDGGYCCHGSHILSSYSPVLCEIVTMSHDNVSFYCRFPGKVRWTMSLVICKSHVCKLDHYLGIFWQSGFKYKLGTSNHSKLFERENQPKGGGGGSYPTELIDTWIDNQVQGIKHHRWFFWIENIDLTSIVI